MKESELEEYIDNITIDGQTYKVLRLSKLAPKQNSEQ